MNSGDLHLRCTEVAEVVALVMTGAVVGAATGGVDRGREHTFCTCKELFQVMAHCLQLLLKHRWQHCHFFGRESPLFWTICPAFCNFTETFFTLKSIYLLHMMPF